MTTTLLKTDGSQLYRPMIYPWAFDAWKKQQQMHWLPEEVSMSDDLLDWKQKLNDKDRDFLTSVLRFFTQADIDVHSCYIVKYLSIFKPIEVSMMLTAIANMETIHIEGYSFLIESLSMPETIYKEFLDYKAMKDKHDYLQNFNVNTPLDLATTIVVYGGLTEGLQLFSSFALLLNYTRHGLMKNMGQIVTWSFRDESLHVECMAKLFKVLLEEESDSSWNKELEKRINEACHMIIECEDAFIDLCYQTSSDAIRNLEKNDVKQYIRYLADRRLNQFGFKEIFNVTENPLPWIDEITSNVEFASFFETRATEYSKGAMTGSWNDAFN